MPRGKANNWQPGMQGICLYEINVQVSAGSMASVAEAWAHKQVQAPDKQDHKTASGWRQLTNRTDGG